MLLSHLSTSSGFHGRYISSLEIHEQASASIVSTETPSVAHYNYINRCDESIHLDSIYLELFFYSYSHQWELQSFFFFFFSGGGGHKSDSLIAQQHLPVLKCAIFGA